MTDTTYCRNLNEIDLVDLPEFGGKAARLGAALRLGCPVLPGVALSTALYRQFMDESGLRGEITNILHMLRPTTLTHFQATEWAIHNAFAVREVPDVVRETLAAAWDALGHRPLAVRSSAIREDSPTHSFVGQHASYLNVANADDLLDAVIGCWHSLYNAKALAYGRQFGVDLVNSAMAVLLQPMVRATQEGAVFTVDPITGNPDSFVIEVQAGSEQGIGEFDPYERSPGEPRLWSRLRRHALALDEHHRQYQAIEWIVDDADALHLMRVRPVTGLPSYLPADGAMPRESDDPMALAHPEGSSQRSLLPMSWYHRSRSERLAAACHHRAHPLFWPYTSLQERYANGYLYCRWRPSRVPPYDAQLRKWRYAWLCARRLWASRRLDRVFGRLWDAERQTLLDQRQADPSTLSNAALADALVDTARIGDLFVGERAHLGDAHLALDDIVATLHRRWVDEDPALAWQFTKTRQDQETACDLAMADAFNATDADHHEAAIDELARRWAHLFIREQPVECWHDLARTDVDLEAFAEAYYDKGLVPGLDVRERNERMTEAIAASTERILAKLPWHRRSIYRRALAVARRYNHMAVDRDEPILLARLLEKELLDEIGARLRNEGLVSSEADAALLTHDELLEWLRGELPRDTLVRDVLDRKDRMRRWARYTPPLTLAAQTPEPPLTLDEAAGDEGYYGRAVSPGRARGKARIIRGIEQSTRVRPGEVIVCPEPHFELTPMFGLACAVVGESGSLLDHSSVLAREYGIPAVFSVDNVTKMIKTGDDVEVDANQGLVVKRHRRIDWNTF